MNRILLYLLVVISFVSCGEMEPDNHLRYSKEDSPHLITESIEGLIGQDFIVQPGAELIISEGVFINLRGNVYLEGTSSEPILINPATPGVGWDKISLKGEAEFLVMDHVVVTDGIITSFGTNNSISNVEFNQTQNLDWSYAIIRFWFGSLSVRDCSFNGVNKCDGILIHNLHDAFISNNEFFQIPDAVEFVECRDGVMQYNHIVNGNDDGVDLNASENIVIRNNYFEGITDAAMEIGSENFGSSLNVVTVNNRMQDCGKGIWLKESSTLHAVQDSFFNCGIGVDVLTDDDSTRVSAIIIETCEFLGNDIDIEQDMRSEVEIIN